MLQIAITGGIAAGKSTYTTQLRAFGLPVIDLDILARDVVPEALDELVEAFGPEIRTKHGELNRTALARAAFASPEDTATLNGIMHPKIEQREKEQLEKLRAAGHWCAVVDFPLLAESDRPWDYHLNVLIDAPEEVRMARMMRERKMREPDARARIDAQATDEERRAIADIIINNAGTPRVEAVCESLVRDFLAPFAAMLDWSPGTTGEIFCSEISPRQSVSPFIRESVDIGDHMLTRLYDRGFVPQKKADGAAARRGLPAVAYVPAAPGTQAHPHYSFGAYADQYEAEHTYGPSGSHPVLSPDEAALDAGWLLHDHSVRSLYPHLGLEMAYLGELVNY